MISHLASFSTLHADRRVGILIVTNRAGSNPGCGTNGFPAAEGWDPVTGMGTPDFAKLFALAVGNPARAAPPVSSLPPTSTSAAPPESTTALSSPTMGTGDDSAEEELAKLFEDALALLKTLVGPESE